MSWLAVICKTHLDLSRTTIFLWDSLKFWKPLVVHLHVSLVHVLYLFVLGLPVIKMSQLVLYMDSQDSLSRRQGVSIVTATCLHWLKNEHVQYMVSIIWDIIFSLPNVCLDTTLMIMFGLKLNIHIALMMTRPSLKPHPSGLMVVNLIQYLAPTLRPDCGSFYPRQFRPSLGVA